MQNNLWKISVKKCDFFCVSNYQKRSLYCITPTLPLYTNKKVMFFTELKLLIELNYKLL